jgi:hypothetical protein
MMIGASVRRRADGSSVKPSISGSITSSTITSGRQAGIASSISRPFGTVTTENPACCKPYSSMSRMASSSSTTSTRAPTFSIGS